MPKQYEKIRDSLIRSGKDVPSAKRIAAATFNKNRPEGTAPVTGKHEKSPPKRREQ